MLVLVAVSAYLIVYRGGRGSEEAGTPAALDRSVIDGASFRWSIPTESEALDSVAAMGLPAGFDLLAATVTAAVATVRVDVPFVVAGRPIWDSSAVYLITGGDEPMRIDSNVGAQLAFDAPSEIPTMSEDQLADWTSEWLGRPVVVNDVSRSWWTGSASAIV